jgi:hypothetical protein
MKFEQKTAAERRCGLYALPVVLRRNIGVYWHLNSRRALAIVLLQAWLAPKPGRQVAALNRTATPSEVRILLGRIGAGRAPSNARKADTHGSMRRATGSAIILSRMSVAG